MNGFEDFNAEQNGGFGGFEDFTATETATDVTATSVQTTRRASIGDIPLSQINGLQNGKYADLDAARDAIMSMSPEEVLRRRENGQAFSWEKTIIDKIDWVINNKGKRVLKSPKFLGWLVITNDSNGTPVAYTDAQLLSYITANCPQTGKIGTGSHGLQLRHAIRKNTSSKGGNFTNSMVIALVPSEKNVYKYQEDRLEAAKAPVYEADGVTPVKVLKPGAPKGSTKASDFIQKYDWKNEEYRKLFGTRKSAKAKKKDAASVEAFEILAYMNGLKDESAYL